MKTAAERVMEMASVAQSEATRNSQQGQALAQRVAALEQQMAELAGQIQNLSDAVFFNTHGGMALLERLQQLEARLGMEP